MRYGPVTCFNYYGKQFVVEQRVSLVIFILFRHDPLHSNLVALDDCAHSEESILIISVSRFIEVLFSVDNVAIRIVFTNIFSVDNEANEERFLNSCA